MDLLDKLILIFSFKGFQN